jgi:hypothetical protein
MPPELWSFAAAARHVLGRKCQVPASHIYPEDKPELLAQLAGDWDDMEVILELEELLQVPLGNLGDDFPPFLSVRFFWHKCPGAKSVGDWITRVAESAR